jgi:hypothetical protein
MVQEPVNPAMVLDRARPSLTSPRAVPYSQTTGKCRCGDKELVIEVTEDSLWAIEIGHGASRLSTVDSAESAVDMNGA